MRVLRSALVLLATFSLGLSLALPAQDFPETAYDESESLPYEMPPRLSVDLVQEPAAFQIVPIVFADLFSTRERASGRAVLRETAAHFFFESLIIRDHSLRC